MLVKNLKRSDIIDAGISQIRAYDHIIDNQLAKTNLLFEIHEDWRYYDEYKDECGEYEPDDLEELIDLNEENDEVTFTSAKLNSLSSAFISWYDESYIVFIAGDEQTIVDELRKRFECLKNDTQIKEFNLLGEQLEQKGILEEFKPIA